MTSNSERWLARGRDPRTMGIIIVLTALAVRLLNQFVLSNDPLSIRPDLIPDAAHYHHAAQAIAKGDLTLTPVFFMGPLYSYVLGLLYRFFGSGYIPSRLFQILLGAGIVYMLWRMADAVAGWAVGIVTAVIAIFYYPLLFFERQLLPELMLTFLTTAILFLLVGAPPPSWRRAASIGALLGLAAQTKGMALFWLPFLLPLVWRRDRKGPAAFFGPLALLVATAIVILPATLHNYLVGNDLVLLTSNVGINFYLGNGQQASGTWRPPDISQPWIGRSPEALLEYSSIIAGRELKPSAASNFWIHKTWDEIKPRPVHFLKLLVMKFLLFWNYFEICNNNDYYLSSKFSPYAYFLSVGFGFVAPVGVIGLFFARFARREQYLFWSLITAIMLNALAFFVLARYRLPIVAPLIIAAAALIVKFWHALAHNEWRRIMLPATLVLGVTLITRVPVISDDAKAEFHASYVMRLAEAQRLENKPEEAERTLRDAVKLQPENAQFRVQLATLYYLFDKIEQAAREARVAVALNRAVPLGHFILGLANAKTGDYQAAIREFKIEVANFPDDPRSYYHLGRVLTKVKRYDEAHEAMASAAKLDPSDDRYRKALAWLAQQTSAASAQEPMKSEPPPESTTMRQEGLIYSTPAIKQ